MESNLKFYDENIFSGNNSDADEKSNYLNSESTKKLSKQIQQFYRNPKETVRNNFIKTHDNLVENAQSQFMTNDNIDEEQKTRRDNYLTKEHSVSMIGFNQERKEDEEEQESKDYRTQDSLNLRDSQEIRLVMKNRIPYDNVENDQNNKLNNIEQLLLQEEEHKQEQQVEEQQIEQLQEEELNQQINDLNDQIQQDNLQNNQIGQDNQNDNQDNYNQKPEKFLTPRRIIVISIIVSLILIGIVVGIVLGLKSSEVGEESIGQFIEIDENGIYFDQNSGQNTIKYPIAKSQFIKALQSQKLEVLPIKFEEREEANYTAKVSFKMYADGFPNNDQYTTDFNVTFYTQKLTKDYISIITYYYTTSEKEDDIIEDDSELPEDLKEQFRIIEEAAESDSEEAEKIMKNFLEETLKISKCKVSRKGKLIDCEFVKGMTREDRIISVNLLQLYIPDLAANNFITKDGKLRVLNKEDAKHKRILESTILDSNNQDDNSIGLNSGSDKNSTDDVRQHTLSSDSAQDLNLETGKIDAIDRSDSFSMAPQPQDPKDEDAQEPPVKKIKQSSNVLMKRISSSILKENITEEAKIYFIETVDFDYLKDPVTYFNNITAEKQGNTSYNSSEFEELGRNLQNAGRRSPFEDIRLSLAKINLMIANIQTGFAIQCQSESLCDAGLFIDVQPITFLWVVKSKVQIQMMKTVREYRHFKTIIQSNIDVFQRLTDQVTGLADNLLFDTLDDVQQNMKLFLAPMETTEKSIKDYTESVVKGAIDLTESLSLSKLISSSFEAHYADELKGFKSNSERIMDDQCSLYLNTISSLMQSLKQSNVQYSSQLEADLDTLKRSLFQNVDNIIPQYLQSEEGFYQLLGKSFSNISDSFNGIGSSSPLLRNMPASIINILLTEFTKNLLQIVNPAETYMKNMKDNIKMNFLINHASCRQTMDQLLSSSIDFLVQGTGSYETTHQQQIQTLNRYLQNKSMPTFDLHLDSKSIMENIDELVKFFIDTLAQETMNAADSAESLIKDMINTTDGFFKGIFTDLLDDFSKINGTVFNDFTYNITSRLSSLNIGAKRLQNDLESVYPNLQTQLNVKVDMNSPSLPLDLNQEVKDVKVMLNTLDEIWEQLRDISKLTERVNNKIDSLEQALKYTLDGPSRIKNQLDNTLSAISELRNKLQLSFDLPDLSTFSQSIKLDEILNQVLDVFQQKAKGTGIDVIGKLAKGFDGKFFINFEELIDEKLKSVLPSNPRQTLFQQLKVPKSLLLFYIAVPLPVGVVYFTGTKQFEASLYIYYAFENGDIYLATEAQATLSYNLNIYYSLLVVQTGVTFKADVFKGLVHSRMGVQILPLRPKAFINSGLAFNTFSMSYKLVYRFKWIRIRRVCWRIRIARWFKITICILVPQIYWVPWRTISQYNKNSGNDYEKTLIDRKWVLELA